MRDAEEQNCECRSCLLDRGQRGEMLGWQRFVFATVFHIQIYGNELAHGACPSPGNSHCPGNQYQHFKTKNQPTTPSLIPASPEVHRLPQKEGHGQDQIRVEAGHQQKNGREARFPSPRRQGQAQDTTTTERGTKERCDQVLPASERTLHDGTLSEGEVGMDGDRCMLVVPEGKTEQGAPL